MTTKDNLLQPTVLATAPSRKTLCGVSASSSRPAKPLVPSWLKKLMCLYGIIYIGRDPFSPLCAPHPPCAGRSADVPVSLYARICSAHPSAPLVCRGAAAMPWRQVKAI